VGRILLLLRKVGGVRVGDLLARPREYSARDGMLTRRPRGHWSILSEVVTGGSARRLDVPLLHLSQRPVVGETRRREGAFELDHLLRSRKHLDLVRA